MGKKEKNVNSIYTTTEYLSILHSLEKQTNLELDKKRIIGKGGYSQVYQAKSKGRKIFAAKIITIPKIEDKTNDIVSKLKNMDKSDISISSAYRILCDLIDSVK